MIRFSLLALCRRPLPTLLFVGAAVLSASCAGAWGSLDFDTLLYPASTSGYLYRHTGQSASLEEMEVLRDFTHEKRFFGMFYSAIPLPGSYDIGSVINDAVRQSGGDGLVNVSVAVDDCGINKVPILPFTPLWPGCAKVVVTGLVVRMKPPEQHPRPQDAETPAVPAKGDTRRRIP